MTAGHTATSAMASRAKVSLLLALLLAGGMRWRLAVLEDAIKPDETVYVSAAGYWSAGSSPYEESFFFYPPVFAWMGSMLTEAFGTLGYLKTQRAASLVGICLATWLSLLIARWRWWPALAFGTAWLWFSPVVALPIVIGNATGLSTALTLAGMWFWVRHPILAGGALGVGQALKPLAPLAPLCLLAQRRGASPRRSLQAGLASLFGSGILLLVGLRYLPGLFSNATGAEAHPYNFSLHRVLAGFGLSSRPLWILVIVGLAGLWWIARQNLTKLEFLVVVLVLNLLAAPILWAHSLLLFLPVQLLAVSHLLRALRPAASVPATAATTVSGRTALPHLLACLALVSTVLSPSLGGLSAEPGWIQSLVLAVPLLSLPYLGGYVLTAIRDQTGTDRPEALSVD